MNATYSNLVADKLLPRLVILQAFDTVLSMNGVATVNQGEEFVLVVQSQTASTMAKQFTTNGPAGYNEALMTTHIVQVKHAEVKEAVEVMAKFASAQNAQGIVALESTKTVVLRDYQANVKRMLEVLAQIDVLVEDDFTLEVIPIKYGKVEEVPRRSAVSLVAAAVAVAPDCWGVNRPMPIVATHHAVRRCAPAAAIIAGARAASVGGMAAAGAITTIPLIPILQNPNWFEPQQSTIAPIEIHRGVPHGNRISTTAGQCEPGRRRSGWSQRGVRPVAGDDQYYAG